MRVLSRKRKRSPPDRPIRGLLRWNVHRAVGDTDQDIVAHLLPEDYSNRKEALGVGTFGTIYLYTRQGIDVAVKVVLIQESLPMETVLQCVRTPQPDTSQGTPQSDTSKGTPQPDTSKGTPLPDTSELNAALEEVVLAQQMGDLGVGPALLDEAYVAVGPDAVRVVFVMERMDRDLRTFSPRQLALLENPITSLFEQVAHLGYVTDDIKPENIMIRKAPMGGTIVRLIDFGGGWCTPHAFPPTLDICTRQRLRVVAMQLRLFLHSLRWSESKGSDGFPVGKWFFVQPVLSFYQSFPHLIPYLETHVLNPHVSLILTAYLPELKHKEATESARKRASLMETLRRILTGPCVWRNRMLMDDRVLYTPRTLYQTLIQN